MKPEIEILINTIRDDLGDVEQVVKRTETIYIQAISSNNFAYYDALALNLHGFYMGIERIFEDIARTIEKHLPNNEKWHRALLQQMSLEIPSTRPPVIQKQTSNCLDEYLRFRHFVRHGYTLNFQANRVKELAEMLPECFTAVQQDLNNFIQFLHQLTNY
ncbi:MAG: hypothetical protein R3D55_13385 [Chloroflexota bacterium]